MKEFKTLGFDSINSYFDTLSILGHVKNSDTYNLIVLMFILKLLKFSSYGYITEEDYRSIVNSIYCICGKSCIIKFPKYEDMNTLIHSNNNSFIPRISQNSILRQSELHNIRVKA